MYCADLAESERAGEPTQYILFAATSFGPDTVEVLADAKVA